MRWIVWIVAGIGLIALLIVVVGYSLPVRHKAIRVANVTMPPTAVYTLLADVDRYGDWRPAVKALDRQPDRDGRPAWTETVSGMKIPLYFERMVPPSVLVARIAGPSLPFGGTWTYSIAPAGAGSEVTITEDGEVYNPFFRFMSRFVFGYYATLDEFVKNLESRAR
jgi:polyketide cyclase/dehydrase/lipid transport protein